MKVTETLKEGLKRGYRITIPAEEIDAFAEANLATSLAKGLSPGRRKAQIAMLKTKNGPKLIHMAVQAILEKAAERHFEDTGERPARRPDVGIANGGMRFGEDVEVDMFYEVPPEIPEVDLNAISAKKLKAAPGEAGADGESSQDARMEMRERLFDMLDGMADFELPPGMVENEAKQVARALWPEEKGSAAPKEIEPDPEHVELARRRVRIGLLLTDIGRRNGIGVSEEDIARAAMGKAPGGDVSRVLEQLRQNPAQLEMIQAQILEEKVVEFIIKRAERQDLDGEE